MSRGGRGEILKRIPFALQHTPPPCPPIGSGGGRELRDGSPPSTVCLLLAPPPYPPGLLATSAGMQAPQSPPTFQAELGGFTLGQVHPISNSFPLPPTLCEGSRKPGMGDSPGPSAPDSSLASCWVVTCTLGDPASYQQEWKARWLEKGGGGEGCCQPGPPWASGLGSGGRGEGRGAAAAGIPGSLDYPARSSSSDTQCPAKPQAFY